MTIDPSFDFRSDTPEGKDPDAYSATLRRYHQIAWSRPLPSGFHLDLEQAGSRGYLVCESDGDPCVLSSDTFTTSHMKKLHHLYKQVPSAVNEHWQATCYTMGGVILFPAKRINMLQTINAARGWNPLIQDRSDLTVECIRRWYESEQSPLSEVLDRYSWFFAMFGSFDGYIKFFDLHELASPTGAVNFFRPFDDFGVDTLPREIDDYLAYRDRQLEFIKARGNRIANRVG